MATVEKLAAHKDYALARQFCEDRNTDLITEAVQLAGFYAQESQGKYVPSEEEALGLIVEQVNRELDLLAKYKPSRADSDSSSKSNQNPQTSEPETKTEEDAPNTLTGSMGASKTKTNKPKGPRTYDERDREALALLESLGVE